MRDTGKSDDRSLWAVESISIGSNDGPIDLGNPFVGTQQRVAKRVILEGSHVDELGYDKLGFLPDLGDFIAGGDELLLYLLIGDSGLPYRFGYELGGCRYGGVEGGGLVHHGLPGGNALYVPAQGLDGLYYLPDIPLLGRLKG